MAEPATHAGKGQAEQPDKEAQTPDEVVRRWLAEIDVSKEFLKPWWDRAEKVWQRYRAEEEVAQTDNTSRFPILWANVQLLTPALYNHTPTPDVRRRYRKRDKIGRQAAQVVERAASWHIDHQDFDDEISDAVLDHAVVGLGQCRVRYNPVTEKVPGERIPVQLAIDEGMTLEENGERRALNDDEAAEVQQEGEELFLQRPDEKEIVEQDTVVEHVAYDRWGFSPAKRWKKVRFVWFWHEMTRDELIEAFGEKGRKCVMDLVPDGDSRKIDEIPDYLKRATVYEVWDKVTRKVISVSPGHPSEPLEVTNDPLGLQGFFPCPKPIWAIRATDSMRPVIEYTMYQDQAEELQEVTTRIRFLIKALKVRGVYDATQAEIEQLLSDTEENKLVPLADWAPFAEAGGIQGAVDFMPLQDIKEALVGLYMQREQILNTIFQIVGLSDIMRGATDPNETYGAQRMKGQFGTMRLSTRQREVQRFARDILRLFCEVVIEHYDVAVLEDMTGMEIPEEVVDLLDNDDARSFRIDIETDSTIQVESEGEKQQVIEFVTATSGFWAQIGPLVAEGIIPRDVAIKMFLWAARRFKISREVEEELEGLIAGDQTDGEAADDQAQQPAQQPQASGEAAQAAGEAQGKMLDVAVKKQVEEAKIAQKDRELTAEMQVRLKELEIEERKLALQEREQSEKERLERFRLMLDSEEKHRDRNLARDVARDREDTARRGQQQQREAA